MTLDLGGEAVAGSGVSLTIQASANVDAGDAVVFDSANDRVDETSADLEDVFGIAAEDVDANDDLAKIWVSGLVVANAGASVVQGDVLFTDAGNNGQLQQDANSEGMSLDATTDDGNFAPANPMAVSDSGGVWPPEQGNELGDNEAVVYLR